MEKINYKNVNILKKYITRRGKIFPGAKTGLSSSMQRLLTVEVKKARFMALLPYISRD
jgi:small subunit ribosomal protein S18